MRLARKRTLMRLFPDSGKLIPTTANQTFTFVSDSTKLDRACSSNVYSILTTKAEVVFIMVYAVHVNHYRHICTPLILPHGFCYNYARAQTVCTRHSLLLLLRA